LQRRAVAWAKLAWVPVVIGMGLISIITPLVSATVRERWFSMPAFIALLPIPLMTVTALVTLRALLNTQRVLGTLCWLPFALNVAVFLLGFFGMAYSLYPYVVMDRLTIWQAASSPQALKVILIGVAISVPGDRRLHGVRYRVFRGKAGELRYA
jgi:cytochrome d ubiquinol oxidase subunit II